MTGARAAVAAAILLAFEPSGAVPFWKPQATVPDAEYPRPASRKRGLAPPKAVERRLNPRCRASRDRARHLLYLGRYAEALAGLDEVVGICSGWCAARRDRARAAMMLGYLRWDPKLVEKAARDYEHCCGPGRESAACCWLARVAENLLDRIRQTHAMRGGRHGNGKGDGGGRGRVLRKE